MSESIPPWGAPRIRGELLKLGNEISQAAVSKYMVRRECLHDVIIPGEEHQRRALHSYFEYYHGSRTHPGLEKDCPVTRRVESPQLGRVSEEPMVAGLHHRYFRRAA